MATGKYLACAERFIASARNHFCTDHDVTYFLFTDGKLENPSDDIVVVEQKRLGWPYDTLMRFHAYSGAYEKWKEMDYMFASDADMLFVSPVGKEMFGKWVATIHPGFYQKKKRGSYETDPRSTACVESHEGRYYFAGGFYGGEREEFYHFLQTAIANVDKDLSHDFVAVWHDESHLNRYCIDHPPTVRLSPSYCYAESWNLPFKKKLLALDKKHDEMRK